MRHSSLGLVGILGFAGAGKTETAAIASLCLIGNPHIMKIYCSAATNIATDNFAERLNRIGQSVHFSLLQKTFRVPMVVRGYQLS